MSLWPSTTHVHIFSASSSIFLQTNTKARSSLVVFYLSKTQKAIVKGSRAPPETEYVAFAYSWKANEPYPSVKVSWHTANGQDINIEDPKKNGDTVIKFLPPVYLYLSTPWIRADFTSREVITYPNVHQIPAKDIEDPTKYKYHVNVVTDKLFSFLIQTEDQLDGSRVTKNFLQLAKPITIFTPPPTKPPIIVTTLPPPTEAPIIPTTVAIKTTPGEPPIVAETTVAIETTPNTNSKTTPEAVEQTKNGGLGYVWITLGVLVLLLLVAAVLGAVLMKRRKSKAAVVTPVSALGSNLRSTYDSRMTSTIGDGSSARSTYQGGMPSTVGSNIDGRSTFTTFVLPSSSVGTKPSKQSKNAVRSSKAPSSSAAIPSKLV